MHVLAFLLSGLASWYDLPGSMMADSTPFVSSHHICAMRRPWPMHARLEIVNTSTGQHSWCVVHDRGPAAYTGRILDVSPPVRDELGFGVHGVIHVGIYRVVGMSRAHVRPLKCTPQPTVPLLVCHSGEKL